MKADERVFQIVSSFSQQASNENLRGVIYNFSYYVLKTDPL